jgi:prolyl-tRNA editing enzyme YbaK/EbsC (Cys-tRNA(Pro) deacylase)
MNDSLSNSAKKVQAILLEHGLELQVVELSQTTRTAAEAAQAIGCRVGQIAKSLIFKTSTTGQPVLVIASGINRVDEKILAARLGEDVQKADADFVRQITGFAIGGVPPIGHLQKIPTFIDPDLMQYEEIWAAAGTPYAVFKLTPDQLLLFTAGTLLVIH